MTDAELAARAHANLAATYRAIGKAGPDAEMCELGDGMVAFRSPFRHPVGNFALCPRIDAESLQRLRGWIGQRAVYNVYTFAQLGEAPDERTMERHGFRHSSMLSTMAVEEPVDNPSFALRYETSRLERRELSAFIAAQFFPRQTAEIRGVIAATTEASGLPLAWILRRDERIGAVMLQAGDDLLGIYNFCLGTSYRGKGWGAAALGAVHREAHSQGRAASLQCEPALAGWYLDRGCREIAAVDVWTASFKKEAVIIV